MPFIHKSGNRVVHRVTRWPRGNNILADAATDETGPTESSPALPLDEDEGAIRERAAALVVDLPDTLAGKSQ